MKRRRHKRYDVDGVKGTLFYELDAEILNMSLTGLAIETSSMLKVGRRYRLRIEGDESDDLRLDLDVKWCHLVDTEEHGTDVRPVYHAGFDFRDVLDEKARQILRFLEGHVIVEMEQRIFGRFVLEEEAQDEIQVAADRRFVVRRISLSGMLIVTDLVPELDRTVGLEIELPEHRLEASGRIAYIEPEAAIKEEDIAVGVEFRDMEENHRAALEAFIEDQIE